MAVKCGATIVSDENVDSTNVVWDPLQKKLLKWKEWKLTYP
jgi:hypothetical protein